jgi:hypothetical protein
MPDINNEYLIDKMEEQEEVFRTRLADTRKSRDKHISISKELYECLLDRIYNPPIVKGFETTPTPRERAALNAFTNRDDA